MGGEGGGVMPKEMLGHTPPPVDRIPDAYL